MMMITRRAFTKAVAVVPLVGLPTSRVFPPAPTGYTFQVPDFERHLEFPDGVQYPVRVVLCDPSFRFEWHDRFTAQRHGDAARVKLLSIDRFTGGPPRVGVLPPEEIEPHDGRRYLWDIPQEFRQAARRGAHFMLECCPLAILAAAITDMKFLFDADILTPTFDPHPEFGFPTL